MKEQGEAERGAPEEPQAIQEAEAAPAEEAEEVEVEQGGSRRRGKAWWVGLVLAVLAAFVVGWLLGGDGGGEGGQQPGQEAHEHEGAQEKGQVWTCSMHPQIQQPEPGQCPICGMDLIPASDGAGSGQPLGPDEIRLTERARALARIQTTKVTPRARQESLVRLLGRLDYDETRIRTVVPWTGGRIERLHVATTGQKIRKGQTVATLYSPEVYEAQQDLIEASRQLVRLGQELPLARRGATSSLEAARNRLRLLGVTAGELKRMEKAESPWRRIGIRSPFEGTIIDRLVDEGQYVSAGSGLYRLADLSRLWVQLDAYEQDLAWLEEGSLVSLTFEALPGARFEGRIAFMDPVVDRQKRTTRVRVEVDNPDGALRPGMFAEAVVYKELASSEVPPLVIPESAPLFSGKRSLVYVEVPGAEEPTYQAREVRLGSKAGDFYPVIAGLEYGERIVTHGAFRLDADLQLRGGQSMMMRGDDTKPGAYDSVIPLKGKGRESLRPVVSAYLDVQEALASDGLVEMKEAVTRLMEASRAVSMEKEAPEAREAWGKLRDRLVVHAQVMSSTGSLDKARAAFEEVTLQMEVLLSTFGNPLDDVVQLAYCPMAFNNRGANWFQRKGGLSNAYFGASMLHCGEVKEAVDTGAYLASRAPKGGAPASVPASGPGAGSGPASGPSSQQGP